ncbi:B3 domain-containing protein [Dendrobium catenatum]|uniref:B3 domain-containing protein n=1 Tax=Dendrobium catenatum TaxID=906689 RepID=A0A2I0X1X2_9ASPA|nr:B3 domain-containing protein [Dendrobium catenatum]
MEESCWFCKKWEQHYYWDHLKLTNHRFMKVMLKDFSQGMAIPKHFVENFKGELSKTINLEVSKGKLWQFNLQKISGSFVIIDGWKEFVDDHGIKEGEYLVFTCSGNSSFQVQIFDNGACLEMLLTYQLKMLKLLRYILSRPNRQIKSYCSISLFSHGAIYTALSSSLSNAAVAASVCRSPVSMASPSSLIEDPSSPSLQNGAAAERRLREAEERLKDAIEELQLHYARRGGGGRGSVEGEQPECDHANESCVAHAIGNLCQTFLLSYGVRVGIGILLRAFKLARRRSYSSIIDLKCTYNSAKSKNKFHLWGSHWKHGDSLLFSLVSAQVMYAFVMRPESLPKAYQDFIQKTGPVEESVYKAVRDTCRGSPVDVISLSAYLSNIKGSNNLNLTEYPSIIPCSIIHPNSDSCIAHNAAAASLTFRKTFPLYFSLTFVPFVVLRLQKEVVRTEKLVFLKAPMQTSWIAVLGAVRSTSFLSAFVALFQAVICLHRKVATKDHKLVYWIAGAFAGLSVLLEKKGRRSELALYVLPRAGDSLWYIIVNRHLLPNVKNAEFAANETLCSLGFWNGSEFIPSELVRQPFYKFA